MPYLPIRFLLPNTASVPPALATVGKPMTASMTTAASARLVTTKSVSLPRGTFPNTGAPVDPYRCRAGGKIDSAVGKLERARKKDEAAIPGLEADLAAIRRVIEEKTAERARQALSDI